MEALFLIRCGVQWEFEDNIHLNPKMDLNTKNEQR